MNGIHRVGLTLALLGLATLGGCGGCAGDPPAQQPEAAPQAQAPAEVAVKPTKAMVPTMVPPTLPPDALTPEPEDPAEALEDDCFVMMDAYPDYGAPPLKVKFSSEVECSSGAPTFKWDFGDGSGPSSDPNPVHTYEKVGEFVASVVVTGPSGGTDSDELDIVVEKDAKEVE